MWVVGDSYLARARRQLGDVLDGAGPVQWRVKGGWRWHHFKPALFQLLETSSTQPRFLLLHLGTNDLGMVSGRQLYDSIVEDLLYARLRLPHTRIVWSWMLPRCTWRHARDIKRVEIARKKLNRRLANFLLSVDGMVIRHDDISLNSKHYMQDGVHLNPVGLSVFLQDFKPFF